MKKKVIRHILILIYFIGVTFLFTLHRYSVDEIGTPAPDGYSRYAANLFTSGVYSSQFPIDDQNVSPEMGRAPGYPFFLSLLMHIDEDYRDFVQCHYSKELNDCIYDGGAAVYIPTFLISLSAYLSFCIALYLGANIYISIIFVTPILYPLVKEVALYQHSEALALPLFALLSFILTSWFSGKTKIWTLCIAGLTLGALALTRTAFLYFIPFAALAILLIQNQQKSCLFQKKFYLSVLFIMSTVIVITPWLYRNATHFDKPQIGSSGVNGVLTMRVQYNKMTFSESICAFIYWIPDSGDDLAKKYCREDQWKRFDLSHPESYRQMGWQHLNELSADGSSDEEIRSKLLSEIISDPVRHFLVSIPIGWRGLHRTIIFVPFIIPFYYMLFKNYRWWQIGALSLTIFTFLFHAAITHFNPRYGVPLLFGFAPSAAAGAEYLFHSLRKKLNFQ